MHHTPTVGILPLYLELYREICPDVEKEFAPFIQSIADGLKTRHVESVAAPVCTQKPDFTQAVSMLEEKNVDCLVTVHLAYSPSLESIDALAGTDLPLLILDTTMDAAFNQTTEPARIMYNHGIHGVQDMANMLLRRKKTFRIVAGHMSDASVLDRASSIIQAAAAAKSLRSTKALRIGPSFPGMGDFDVSEDVLRKTLGIRVDTIMPDAVALSADSVTDSMVQKEVAADRAAYEMVATDEAHSRSVRAGLHLRAALERGAYSAFSMNFLEFVRPDGPMDTTPFLEAGKAMARGIGYGGEGDILTAAVVGSFIRNFGDTTFTEIFCPDWKGNSVFLSHMGEINPAILQPGSITIRQQATTFSPTNPGAYFSGAMREGKAVFVNCAPGPDDTFSLIIAPVTMLPDTQCEAMKQSVRGWMQPSIPVADFLQKYSEHGGTHHSALVYGDRVEALVAYALYTGMKPIVIA